MDLLSSGLTLAAAGALITWCRNLPAALGRFLLRRLTVAVEVRGTMHCEWVGAAALNLWALKAQHLQAVVWLRTEREVSVATEPAIGAHLLRRHGRVVLMLRSRQDATATRDPIDSLRLIAPGRRVDWLGDMLREGLQYGRESFSKRSPVLLSSSGGWLEVPNGTPRPLASVVLPGTMAEDATAAVRLFLSRRDWYGERGIPWRFSVGLFGPPGSGKSSFVKALCGEFVMPLYILGLAGCSDEDLTRLLIHVPPRSAVLFDDLDAALTPGASVRRDDASAVSPTLRQGVTLAGLLGALCGPAAGEGRVIFITANRPEMLDAAIRRPGRMDLMLNLGSADADQACRLYELWYPGDQEGAEHFAAEGVGASMAELQARLLTLGAQHAKPELRLPERSPEYD